MQIWSVNVNDNSVNSRSPSADEAPSIPAMFHPCQLFQQALNRRLVCDIPDRVEQYKIGSMTGGQHVLLPSYIHGNTLSSTKSQKSDPVGFVSDSRRTPQSVILHRSDTWPRMLKAICTSLADCPQITPQRMSDWTLKHVVQHTIHVRYWLIQFHHSIIATSFSWGISINCKSS